MPNARPAYSYYVPRPSLIFVLLLRISLGACLIPASLPNVNSGDPAAAATLEGPAKGNSVKTYQLDHAIGEKEAEIAFNAMADDLINKDPPSWCPACTETVVQYCLDLTMLKDHCCCDSGHTRDMLPWLPHSCFVGEKCKPHIGSCMKYVEIRECCCDRIMAAQWRRSSASSILSRHTALQLAVAILLMLRIRTSGALV